MISPIELVGSVGDVEIDEIVAQHVGRLGGDEGFGGRGFRRLCGSRSNNRRGRSKSNQNTSHGPTPSRMLRNPETP